MFKKQIRYEIATENEDLLFGSLTERVFTVVTASDVAQINNKTNENT